MIRCVALCLCVLLCGLASTRTVSAQADLASAAEAAYRAGDYEAAKRKWSALLKERGADGRIEYDLGNCEYRLGDAARAIWRYERAQRALGADERVRFNLTLAERRLGLERGDAASFLADLRAGVRRLERGDWFFYGLGLEVLGLLVLALSIRARARGLAIFAVLLVVSGIACLVRCATLDDSRVLGAVVLAEGTQVRAEPRAALTATMRLGAGLRVEHLAASPQWIRIRYRDREGWVEREAVGLY